MSKQIEAMKLALDDLISEYHRENSSFAKHVDEIFREATLALEWVGLTDEDKQIAFDDTQEGGGFWDFADAIEAILKRKNK